MLRNVFLFLAIFTLCVGILAIVEVSASMVESTITKKASIPYDTLHWQNSRRIARISNGTYFMFYCNNSFPDDNIDSARSFDGGVTWHHWMVIDEHPPDMYCPSTIPDSHDNIHLVWMYGGNIKYRMYNTTNNSWTGSQYISSVGTLWGGGNEPTLDIDSNNKLWAAWYNSNPYYTAQCVNSTDLGSHWSPVKNISTESPFLASGYKQSIGMFAFKSNGDGFYVWTGQHVGMADLSRYCIRMRKYYAANSSWSTKIINVSTPLGYVQTQRFAAIATDESNNLHISWYNFDNPKIYYRVFYAANNSFSGCNYVAVGVYPSIALDSSSVYILYGYPLEHGPGSGYANISYVKGSIASWTTTKVTRWNGSGENVFKDPVSFYSRYPVNGLGSPSNRPVAGLAFCFMNLSYWKNYEVGVQTIGRIYFRLENVTWTPGCGVVACGNTNVNTTRATLHAQVVNATSAVFTAGFYVQYGGVPSSISYQYNFTAGTDFKLGAKENIWYNATGLSNVFDYNYYYVRPWTHINTLLLSNWSYMLMKPANVTSASVLNTGGKSIEVQWITPAQPIGNLYTICRYSSTSYPGTPFAGTGGFNISTTPSSIYRYNITGLSTGTKYYISLFTFLSCAGSPWMHSWSSSFVAIYGNTSGGLYNITFKWENTTYHNPFRNNSVGHYRSNCTLIVQYANRTEYNVFGYTSGWNFGYKSIQTAGDWNHTAKGYVTLSLLYTPLWFTFKWNTTNNVTQRMRCERTLIANSKNQTFYVITDKFVYGEYNGYSTFNNTLVKYEYTLSDQFANFLSRDPFSNYVIIYTYDNNGSKIIVDKEYLDSSFRIHPYLVYGKTYFLGLVSLTTIFDQITTLPTGEYTSAYISIPYLESTDFWTLTYSYGWSANTLWFYYTNQSIQSTQLQLFTFYNQSVGTQVYGSNSPLSAFNYSTILNQAHVYFYIFKYNVSGRSYYQNGTINAIYQPQFNSTNINQYMNMTFGHSPIRDPNDSTKYVTWVSLIIFGVFVVIICCIPGINAGLAGLAAGGWLIFAGIMFTNATAILGVIGVIMLIMSVLYMWGDKQ